MNSRTCPSISSRTRRNTFMRSLGEPFAEAGSSTVQSRYQIAPGRTGQDHAQKGLILHSRKCGGSANISPASLHRTAHSSRLRYWSKFVIFPNHSVPDELVMTTTFGTSQGPTQPLIVNWTRFSSPRVRHSFLNHSTGTSGKPRSVLPQQQPRQIVTCPIPRRFVLSG
jgi:hypothetical protein